MPKFHFHIEDGAVRADPEGTELTDMRKAEDAAVLLLAEMLRGDPSKFWRDETFQVRVCDDVGLTLFTLDLSATRSAATHRFRIV